MGILKGCAKLVGSAVLGAAGVASTVLKGMADTVGFDLGSEVFGAIKDGSFEGIRSMWDSEGVSHAVDVAHGTSQVVEDGMRQKGGEAALQLAKKYEAQAARESDPEKRAELEAKAERFMEKYYNNQ